jgi:diguanylate cyclase (GGDEF)-like protein
MSFKRWVSTPVLVGGSIVTLVIVTLGVLQAGISVGAFQVFAAPFVLLSSLFNQKRIYLILWGVSFIVFVIVNWLLYRSLPLLTFTAMLWFIMAVAAEIIYQLASQRRLIAAAHRRRTRELDAMDLTMTELTSDTDLGLVLQSIVERAAELLKASVAEIALYDRGRNDLEVAAHYPPNAASIGYRMKIGEGAMGYVAQTRQPQIINNYKEWAHALPEQISFGVEMVADVPLLKDNELMGVLGVGRQQKTESFTEEDLHLLGVFARQAVIAINNARLYEEIQRLAYTDTLTGINNRRRLFELLEKEYMRARRYKRPLSLMLLDIDHFKAINDQYGHAAGDMALRWFAQQCSKAIRKNMDVIGRFGGEEFMILFPETSLESACEVSRRLLNLISGGEAPIGDKRIPIAFSAGLVSLEHEENTSLDQLIEQADRALYLAKESRGCVACWDPQIGEPRLVAESL